MLICSSNHKIYQTLNTCFFTERDTLFSLHILNTVAIVLYFILKITNKKGGMLYVVELWSGINSPIMAEI